MNATTRNLEQKVFEMNKTLKNLFIIARGKLKGHSRVTDTSPSFKEFVINFSNSYANI